MNNTNSTHLDYQAFLLRLWRDDTRKPWRASLQSASTNQTVHFADIEALFAFLEIQTSANKTLDVPGIVGESQATDLDSST